jgi:hypothetical protein
MEVTMTEHLLTPSGIKLYGRVETGLTLVAPPAGAAIGANNFLFNQLNAANATLARIYAFSHEGHMYDLPKPAIFVVHGTGTVIKLPNRSDVDTSGVVRKEWEFSAIPAGSDLFYWEYEKGDFSLRLDIESGPFEQILLAPILRGGSPLVSGSDLRTSGSDLRISGSDLRNRR